MAVYKKSNYIPSEKKYKIIENYALDLQNILGRG